MLQPALRSVVLAWTRHRTFGNWSHMADDLTSCASHGGAAYAGSPGGYDAHMTTTPAEPVQDPDQQPIIQPDEPSQPDTTPGTGDPDLDPQR
ncbi:hypothetical protein ASG49_06430 [Marmoricola sp. Leaf446]|nr:hypothetical protein ASG49_06430 [Marmoricola sp. Leaf446]